MQLASFTNEYYDFYAPNHCVKVSGQELVRDLEIPVSQVEVDMVLGAASRFSFTVNDSYRPESQSFETGRGRVLPFAFGAEVEIQMGYRDRGGMQTTIKGVITEIATSFPEGASPELIISGYDSGFPMTMGKNTRTWSEAYDSDAAHEIASFHNLNAKITPTKENHAQIEQNQESDWAFLKKLADRNHYEMYVDESSTFRFGPPNDKGKNKVADLVYGEGLLSFKPEANLAGQVTKVEVYGWDPANKKTIVGVASAGEESGLEGRSAGQFLGSFVRDPSKAPVMRLRQPVFTQAEANTRAKAALSERAKQFLTGEGESLGLPELRPDRSVALTRLGQFTKVYYIQQATHKVDSSGYRTRFKVKETGL